MKEIIKKWWFWVICVLAILCIIFIILFTNTTIYKNDLINRYNKVSNEKSKKEEIIKKKDEEIAKLNQEDKQKEINSKIKKLEEQKETTNKEIGTLKDNKNNLEKEIQNLKGDIIKIKGEEKQYPAGYLTAGTDFPVGRYKIYAGSSNFIVRSLAGNLRVNIILGDEVSEYIYEFSTGDKVQAESSFKMVLVN